MAPIPGSGAGSGTGSNPTKAAFQLLGKPTRNRGIGGGGGDVRGVKLNDGSWEARKWTKKSPQKAMKNDQKYKLRDLISHSIITQHMSRNFLAFKIPVCAVE